MRTNIVWLVIALAGCTVPAGPLSDGMGAVVGLSKSALLSCAGVPAREIAAGTRERLTFVRAPSGPDPRAAVVFGGGSDRIGIGIALPLNPPPHGCEATAVLDRGIVQALEMSPDSDPQTCAPLFANCDAPERP